MSSAYVKCALQESTRLGLSELLALSENALAVPLASLGAAYGDLGDATKMREACNRMYGGATKM